MHTKKKLSSNFSLGALKVLITSDFKLGFDVLKNLTDDQNLETSVNLISALIESKGLAVNKLSSSINLQEAVSLYVYLANYFSPSEQNTTFIDVSSNFYDVRVFQRDLTTLIASYGKEGILALEDLKLKYPCEPLRYAVIDATLNYNKSNWVAFSEKSVVDMLLKQPVSETRTAQDLLNEVTLNLKKLQKELDGPESMSTLLWDYCHDFDDEKNIKNVKPKNENASKVFLRTELANRIKGSSVVAEPEINSSVEGWLGERVDLAVSKTSVESGKQVKVYIEIKQVWNPELYFSLKEQLIDSYVKTGYDTAGLYLAVWYDTSIWTCTSSSSQNNKRTAESKDIGSAANVREKLNKQVTVHKQYRPFLDCFVLEVNKTKERKKPSLQKKN